jgi:hypothetical protein
MARNGRAIPGVVVTTGNPDTVNDSFPTNTNVGNSYDLSGQLGAVYRSADGTKEWIYARFSSTSTGKTPAAGQLCYWWSSTSTSTTNSDPTWVVDNQTSAGNANKVTNIAGVLRNACTRGNAVWLLRKAPSANVTSTTTGYVTGNTVIATTASGEASFISSTSTAAPAGGIGTANWFVGLPRVGYVNSTTKRS